MGGSHDPTVPAGLLLTPSQSGQFMASCLWLLPPRAQPAAPKYLHPDLTTEINSATPKFWKKSNGPEQHVHNKHQAEAHK